MVRHIRQIFGPPAGHRKSVHTVKNENYMHNFTCVFFLICSKNVMIIGKFEKKMKRTSLGYGYTGARNDTTQQSGQTPDKEAEIKNITVYVSGYTETDTTGMLSPPTVWRQQSEFVSSRQSGQTPAAVRIGFECRCNGQNVSNKYGHACRIKCSHTCLRCIARQMLVCCVVSALDPV